MVNDLLKQLRAYDMVSPGDRVYCAVSGGADSMALLWGIYLLREKLDIQVCAAHFNHHLRGEESDRDEQFVREFCKSFSIELVTGGAQVQPGKKGLEAAAREARYAFFRTLPGKVATAHTADDNAETVLMHLVRGTGLKGLGGIAPKNDQLIRPLLTVTRQQVLAFLQEYHIDYVEDSSNAQDAFLRNRLRHHVMPLLKEENPRLAENVSAMAMRLRQDEAQLAQLNKKSLPSVTQLKAMPQAQRSRALEAFLKTSGVKEPEAKHIALAQELVFSERPSACGYFPDGVKIARNYDRLEVAVNMLPIRSVALPQEGEVALESGFRVICSPAQQIIQSETVFTVQPQGEMTVRCRQSGDEIRLPGGTKSLKKLFIDRKIPQQQRMLLPVIVDEGGILGVYGIGADMTRKASSLPAVQIRFEQINSSERL